MSFSRFDSLTGENGLNHYLESQLLNLKSSPVDTPAPTDSIEHIIQVVRDNSELLKPGNSKIDGVVEFLKSAYKIRSLTNQSQENRKELKKVIQTATGHFSNLKLPTFELFDFWCQRLKAIDEKLYYQTLAGWLNKNTDGDLLNYIKNKKDILGLAPYLTRVSFKKKISEDLLGQILEKAKNLTEISLANNGFKGEALARFVNFSNLTSLVIKDCPNFNFQLPRGMMKLEELHIADCPDLDKPIPTDMLKLSHLTYPIGPWLSYKDLFLLFAENQGLDSQYITNVSRDQSSQIPGKESIEFFRYLSKNAPDRIPDLIDFFDNTKGMAIRFDRVKDYLEFDVDKFTPKTEEDEIKATFVKTIQQKFKGQLIQQLYLSAIFDRLVQEGNIHKIENLYPYLDFFSASSNESLNFYSGILRNASEIVVNPLKVKDSFSAVLEKDKKKEYVESFLCYLRLSPSEEGQQTMLNNLEKILQVKLFLKFWYSFYEEKQTVQFLETTNGIIGDRDVDESTIVLTAMFIEYQKLRSSNRIKEFNFESFKTELAKPTARHFVDIYANYLIADANMKPILIEVYPPDKRENKHFYHPTAHLHAGKLYLNILPEVALKKPDDILGLFQEEFKRLDVQFYGQPGLDRGGLGRQLLAQTMQGIMSGNSRHAKFERCDDGKWRPKAAKSEIMNGKEGYIYLNLGRLLGSSLVWQYPLGQVFNDKFLHSVLSFRDNNFKNPLNISQMFSTLDHQQLIDFIVQNNEVEPVSFQLVKTILLSENSEAVWESARELNTAWEDPDLTEIIEKRSVDEVRNFVRDIWSSPFKSNFEIAYAVAQGIDDIVRWGQMRNLTFDQFASQLQGVLDITKIKENLIFEANSDDPQIIANITNWFHEWLDDHEKTPEALENLIQTLTGARAVIAPISFRLFERNASGKKLKGMFIHSCTNQIDVPLNITREGLREYLDYYGRGELLDFTKR